MSVVSAPVCSDCGRRIPWDATHLPASAHGQRRRIRRHGSPSELVLPHRRSPTNVPPDPRLRRIDHRDDPQDARLRLVERPGPQNIKDVSGDLFDAIRRETGLRNLGNRRIEFAVQFPVPALRATPTVYSEVRTDLCGHAV